MASPPLVVAFAIAGTVNIDFEKEPIAKDRDGKEVFLRDIWPTKEEILNLELNTIKPEIFKETYSKVSSGTDRWNELNTKKSVHFEWNEKSTYIHDPPFFKSA
ncbi:hypothetical protein RZS08_49865, partial [Arthrospira platensis SPKY1]|nr:hypothetical protein [Arthrospira platensis SPKY1]